MSTADVAQAFPFLEYNLTWSILVATSAMYKKNCKQFEVLSPCRKKFDTSFLDFEIVYSHTQFLIISIMTEYSIHDKNDFDMRQLQMFQKVESGWGPIFKVVLEC